MVEALVIELNTEGTVTLPESIRQDLPPGTHFLVRRDKDSIVLTALHSEPSTKFALTENAFRFANELVAEEHQEYLIQVALTNASQE